MRRRKLSSFSDFERALRNGFGLGEGRHYKPWIRVQDIQGNIGRASKIPGIKINRTHHCLSNIESSFFYNAEIKSSVLDIREQFPLFPLDLVMRLADEAGIEYPKDPKTKSPIVMTTDFLLTTNKIKKYLAVAVKPQEKLHNLRVLEKLEIERLWWELLGIEWKLITEKQLPEITATNIKWISAPLRTALRETLGYVQIKNKTLELVNIIIPGQHEITGLTQEISKLLHIEEDTSNYLLRSLIWYGIIRVDLTIPIQEKGMLIIEEVNKDYILQEKIYGASA